MRLYARTGPNEADSFYSKRFALTMASSPLNVLFAMFLGLIAWSFSTATTSAAETDRKLTTEELQWVQDHKRIRVGIMADWPPFNKINAHGASHGISADIIQSIGANTGLEIELIAGPWKDIFPKLVDQKIDALMDVTPKPGREPLMNFTSAYLSIPHAIIAQRDRQRLQSELDLDGLTVALEKGFGNVKWFAQNHPEVKIREYPTTRNCLEAVARGETDAYVGNRAVATFIMTQDVMHNLAVHGRLSRAPTILAIGARKDTPILRDILQKGLDQIEGPVKQEILARWTGTASVMDANVNVVLTAGERQWLAANPEITVGNETDWPPFDFAVAGKPRGMSIDILNLIAQNTGLRLKYVNGFAWSELLQKFNNGEIDILPALYWTQERAKTIAYTPPYASNASVLALRDDHQNWTNFDALKGRRVGIVEGFATADLLKDRYPEIELVPVKNVMTGLQQVAFGDIDAFFDSLGVIAYTLENNVIPNIHLALDPGLKTSAETELRMGVLKTNPHLRNILQKGLEAIEPEKLREIRNRWIPIVDIQEERNGVQKAQRIVIPETETPLFILLAIAVMIFAALAILAQRMFVSAKYESMAAHMGSARFRIMLIFGLVLLVALVSSVSWYAFEHNRTRMVASTGLNLRTVLSGTIDRMQVWREEKELLAERLAEIPDVVTLTRKLIKVPRHSEDLLNVPLHEELLAIFKRNQKGESERGFTVIAQDGTVLFSLDDGDIGNASPIYKAYPERFAQAFKAKSVFIPPFVADKRADGTQPKPALYVTAPIKDRNNNVYAVLAQAWDPAADFSRTLQTGLIGETGETYSFDKKANFVSSSRFADQLVELGLLKSGQSSILNMTLDVPGDNKLNLTHMANAATRGQSGIDLEGYLDYRGVSVVGAWAWLDDWGLGVATEMDAHEAFGPVYTLRNTMLFVVGLTLTLSVGATLFTMALGERTSRALTRAKEELEDRVAERTREVQEQSDLIQAVMDSMTIGVVAFDKDLKLITWNEKYLEVRGYPKDMVFEGAAFEDLTRYDVAQGEFTVEDPERNFIEVVETAKRFEQHSFERRRPNGTYIEVRGGPITGGGFVSTFTDITARKRTEQALNLAVEENKRQTERFRNLTSNLPAMVFQFMALDDEHIHITYASPFMRETFEFGDADENDLTDIFYERFHKEDAQVLRDAFVEVIASNGFFNETFRIRKTNGEVRWLEAAARCYEVTDGFMQWDGLILDITDRKLAEEALRQNEQMLNDMLSTSPVGATIVRSDGTLQYFNEQMADMIGVSPKDLAGTVARDLYVNPQQRDEITRKLQEKEVVRDVEIELKHSSGRSVYALLTLQEMPSQEGYFGWIYDITERKEFLEALAESEEQTRLILESAGDGIFGLNTDGTTEFVNTQACKTLGYTPEELIGKKMHDLVHHSYPDGAIYPQADCHMFAAYRDGKVHHITDEVLWRKDGSSVPVEYTAKPMFKGDDVAGAVVTFQDITQRKEAEDALRESQQLLQGVIENSAAVIFFKDQYGVYQLVNKRWEEVTGVTREDAIGTTDFDIFPKDVAEQFWNNDLDVIRRLELVESEERVVKDGAESTFLSLKFPLVDENGQAEGICGMSTDITDRKNAEQEIKKSEERLRFSLAAMGAYYWVDDLVEGTAVYDSPQFFTQYGYTEEEIPQSIDDYVAMIHPDDLPATMESFQAHLEGKQPLHHAEFRLRRKDGSWVWTSNIGRVIEHDDDGQVVKVAGLTLDIADRKRLEEEITDARDKAESATRAKSAFLAAMSHEIRTPMNGVVGMIDLLRETELDTDQAQMMTTVRDSAFALLQIINDILDFSKIEAGKLVLESIPVSLRDVVEGVSETLIPNSTAKNLRFMIFIDPKIPHWVLTDQVRVRQILFNLLGNAVKFTETTEDHLGVVQLRADMMGDVSGGSASVQFSVIDNGIGMSPEAVNNLFKPFTQAESSTTRRFGGTGLGLSICKSLSDMMGGSIRVESTHGEGSSFIVTMPFKIDASQMPPQDEPDLSGLRILMVSDDQMQSDHILSYIKGHDGDCEMIDDLFAIEQTVVVANKGGAPFDIVLFGSGYDRSQVDAVISALRSNDNAQNIRFVILTTDRKARKGMILPDEVVVGACPMRRSRFLHGLGVASGRCSPDVEDSHEKLTKGVAKAPTPDEAAAQSRLILVVEDNKTNQDVILRQLNALGYACEVSDDGKQGLAAWRRGRYNLILTDCHMPEMDGYAMTKAIRVAESDSGGIDHTPIIAITANALQGEGDRCLATGMDDYLTKPLEMALLKQALAKWMPASADGALPSLASADEIVPDEDHSTQPNTQSDPRPQTDNPAVEPSYLRETFGDDDDLINSILKDFPAPGRDIVGEIDAAFHEHDADGVGKAGHKLKSSSRAIGADALADLCFELEQAGKAGDWNAIETLYPKLQPAFDAVMHYIDAL